MLHPSDRGFCAPLSPPSGPTHSGAHPRVPSVSVPREKASRVHCDATARGSAVLLHADDQASLGRSQYTNYPRLGESYSFRGSSYINWDVTPARPGSPQNCHKLERLRSDGHLGVLQKQCAGRLRTKRFSTIRHYRDKTGTLRQVRYVRRARAAVCQGV
jgi:hypothetical protein